MCGLASGVRGVGIVTGLCASVDHESHTGEVFRPREAVIQWDRNKWLMSESDNTVFASSGTDSKG